MNDFPGRDTLLDTGPLVALLARDDQWHERVAPLWPEETARCVTTEAVLVEASHLARGMADRRRGCSSS